MDSTATGIELPERVVRAIVNQTATPFVCVDSSGTILYAGESIEVIVGWTPEQVTGRNMIEFIGAEDHEMAYAALAEVPSIEHMRSSVPIVVPIRLPAGGWRHIEVAAMPLHEEAGCDLIALRLRSAEPDRHMSDFVQAMLRGEPLEVELQTLARSVTASLEGVGASVHHGFDGASFHGVTGTWPGADALPLTGGPWSEALASGELMAVTRAHDSVQEDLGAVTGWMVPVHPSSGIPAAVLTVWRDDDSEPYVGHRRTFVRARDFVELALVRAGEHDRLVHLARHDALTGVANRAAFRDELAATLARGEHDIAVGFCDLDRFKQVNDRHGHSLGDELLVAFADRLRAGLRAGDELARLGGDEFTILWRNIADRASATSVAARVVDAGAAPFDLHGHALAVGASVGVALWQPGATAEALLAAADVALYEAKATGRGRVVVHPVSD